jgi:hypothetical protein
VTALADACAGLAARLREDRPLVVIAGLFLLAATLFAIALFAVPSCTVTTVYDNGRVVTQNCPPAIPHGWHTAESMLIGAWSVLGFIAGAAWSRGRRG